MPTSELFVLDLALCSLRGRVDDAWRAVCAGCVVSGDCLEYALADASMMGMWAGTTEGDRRRLRASRRRAA